MTRSAPLNLGRPERAFLDANVIRGQLTNDLLLSMAARDVFDPRWTQQVLDEMRRNRPPGVPESKIDGRIDAMNGYFPRAMTDVPAGLEPEMHADAKDQHVLAGAVHSRSDVLVTENVKDFAPPSTGPHAMRVERLSEFLSRKLEENPDRVLAAIEDLVGRNRRDPRTILALIGKLVEQPQIRGFAQRLDARVRAGQQRAAASRPADQLHRSKQQALDGMPDALGAVASEHDHAVLRRSAEAAKPGQEQGRGR
ncbi:PIN domain-containing protein [Kribbella sp. NPDC051770]|uniref:PIN domain-containing protein n=1 Tax=Kribbella sp. NPDC051770 TaxID=3155413 RepID=UPI00341975C2